MAKTKSGTRNNKKTRFIVLGVAAIGLVAASWGGLFDSLWGI